MSRVAWPASVPDSVTCLQSRWGRRFRRDQSRQLTELIYEEFFTAENPTPYDLAGAIESPTLLPFLSPPDLGSLFCSALCAMLLPKAISEKAGTGKTRKGLRRPDSAAAR